MIYDCRKDLLNRNRNIWHQQPQATASNEMKEVGVNLKSTSEGADAAFGRMSTKPGGVAPSDIAIAASYDLVAANRELDQPFVRLHLPYNEATLLGNGGGGGGSSSWSWLMMMIKHGHCHFSRCVHVLDLKLPAAGSGAELVDYVLSRGRHHLIQIGWMGELTYQVIGLDAESKSSS